MCLSHDRLRCSDGLWPGSYRDGCSLGSLAAAPCASHGIAAAFSQSSEDTVDDIIEAFFAFAWKYRSKGFKHPQSILDFVAALNNLCFATWLERFFW